MNLQMERESTKGRGWYNMRAAEMTEETKNDLMVIQMRKVLDPKRFYKGPDIRGALPKYVQVSFTFHSVQFSTHYLIVTIFYLIVQCL